MAWKLSNIQSNSQSNEISEDWTDNASFVHWQYKFCTLTILHICTIKLRFINSVFLDNVTVIKIKTFMLLSPKVSDYMAKKKTFYRQKPHVIKMKDQRIFFIYFLLF